MEYIRVEFNPNDVRTVLADGNPVGQTETTLMLSAGDYDITLSGGGYAPATRSVTLAGTTPTNPLQVTFTPVAPVAAATPVAPPSASALPGSSGTGGGAF